MQEMRSRRVGGREINRKKLEHQRLSLSKAMYMNLKKVSCHYQGCIIIFMVPGNAVGILAFVGPFLHEKPSYNCSGIKTNIIKMEFINIHSLLLYYFLPSDFKRN